MGSQYDFEGPYLRIPGPKGPLRQSQALSNLIPNVVECTLDWAPLTPVAHTLAAGSSNSYAVYRPFSIWDEDFNRGSSEYSAKGFVELAKAGFTHYFVRSTQVYVHYACGSTNAENQQIFGFIQSVIEGEPGWEQTATLQQLRWVNNKRNFFTKRITGSIQHVSMHFSKNFTPGFYWPARRAIEDPNNWGTIGLATGGVPTGTNPANPYEIHVGCITMNALSNSIGVKAWISMRHKVIAWRSNITFPSFMDGLAVPWDTWHAAAGYGEATEVADGPPAELIMQGEVDASGALADIEPAAEWTDDP